MDISVQILSRFLEAKGQFVSGASIAEQIGLSRVSIHNHLEALRNSGFVFSAIRNKGYQLTEEPDTFHPVLFKALLNVEPSNYFKSFIAREVVDSTNNIAETELASSRETPFFIIASGQTSGRGRRGRVWHSPEGKNLYLSVALRPSMPPSRLQTITLWLGLRLCQMLRDRFGLPLMVKWPNDLMIHGKKLAGMLTEARVDAEYTRDLVFGLGLNVNSGESDFPEELRHLANSLKLSMGKPVNMTRLAHQIILCLGEAFQDYLKDDFSEELAATWPQFDFLRGERVEAGSISGVASGITSNGSLRLQRDDGSLAVLHSGEVSLHKKQSPSGGRRG